MAQPRSHLLKERLISDLNAARPPHGANLLLRSLISAQFTPIARRPSSRFNVDAVIVTAVLRRPLASSPIPLLPFAAAPHLRVPSRTSNSAQHLRITALPPPSSLCDSCGSNLLPSCCSSDQLRAALLIPREYLLSSLLPPPTPPTSYLPCISLLPFGLLSPSSVRKIDALFRTSACKNDFRRARCWRRVRVPVVHHGGLSYTHIMMPVPHAKRLSRRLTLARRRRPSRTHGCEFVTLPASAAGASSVTPQNDAAYVQHIFTHAPLARELGHLKRSILSHPDLVIGALRLRPPSNHPRHHLERWNREALNDSNRM
ncbi:hypothetical protein B0H13DRAFT_2685425 [Mycena leptocephala]|nr:hypothetical protein B0H13DRAFT_2685425 [Mycena leptocephala]